MPRIPSDSVAATVAMTTTDSNDEEVLVIVTPHGDYCIKNSKFKKPVQETCQYGTAELVLNVATNQYIVEFANT